MGGRLVPAAIVMLLWALRAENEYEIGLEQGGCLMLEEFNG